MKKLNYLFLSFIFVSCGLDQGKLSTSDNSIGSAMNFEIELTEDKKVQARNVCDALRSKRLKISGASRPDSVSFSILSRNCQKQESRSSVRVEIARSTSQGYVFIPYQAQVGSIDESLVQTDLNGIAATICESLDKNEEIGLVNLDSSNTVRAVDFYESGFVISRGIKSATDGQYYLQERTTYKVEMNSGSLNYGYVTQRVLQSQCEGDSEASETYYARDLINITM